MVVDAEAAASIAIGRGVESPDVAPVVIGEEEGDVVRDAHPLVVVVLYFLIECPELRRLARVLLRLFGDDPSLVGDDALEERDRGALGHRFVAVTSHSHRHDVLARAHAAHSAAPELPQHRIVGLVVPVAFSVLSPFGLRARQRLVVGRAHHDAVLVGESWAQRVVVGECVAPHGGPEVVALHAQHELEDLLVELRVEPPERVACPARESRRLIVDEDSAVLHDGLPIGVSTGKHVQRGLPAHRYVGPVVPRRHADLFGEVVDTEDRPALVAPGDDECLIDARLRLRHDLNDERLPASGEVACIQFSVADESIDERALPDRPDDDRELRVRRGIDRERRLHARDTADVGSKVARGAHDSGVVSRTDEQGCGTAAGGERKSSRRGVRRDIPAVVCVRRPLAGERDSLPSEQGEDEDPYAHHRQDHILIL